jgi:hypothetical protein
VTLSLARSLRRRREVAVRKVLGGPIITAAAPAAITSWVSSMQSPQMNFDSVYPHPHGPMRISRGI